MSQTSTKSRATRRHKRPPRRGRRSDQPFDLGLTPPSAAFKSPRPKLPASREAAGERGRTDLAMQTVDLARVLPSPVSGDEQGSLYELRGPVGAERGIFAFVPRRRRLKSGVGLPGRSRSGRSVLSARRRAADERFGDESVTCTSLAVESPSGRGGLLSRSPGRARR